MAGPRSVLHMITPSGQPSRGLLLLAALCLMTMPQSYRGGAELSHPHAVFQFWLQGGHLSADHHRGGGVDLDHDHRLTATELSAEVGASVRTNHGTDTPTISQMTTSAESGDAIGGVLGTWFVLLLAAAGGLFVVRGMGHGLTPLPERPPPRVAFASS